MAGCSAEEGERSSCPGAAALQSPAGLRALPAGTERRGETFKAVSCWRMQRAHLRRNLHSPSHSKSLTAMHRSILRRTPKSGTSHGYSDAERGASWQGFLDAPSEAQGMRLPSPRDGCRMRRWVCSQGCPGLCFRAGSLCPVHVPGQDSAACQGQRSACLGPPHDAGGEAVGENETLARARSFCCLGGAAWVRAAHNCPSPPGHWQRVLLKKDFKVAFI